MLYHYRALGVRVFGEVASQPLQTQAREGHTCRLIAIGIGNANVWRGRQAREIFACRFP